MTIAIQRVEGGLIWFDAVTKFGRQLSGAVSKHPLEKGAKVTDHTTIENEVITLSCILSDADFNLGRPLVDSQQATEYGLTNKQFVNNTPVSGTDSTGTTYTNVSVDTGSDLTRFLPESVGQFFGTDRPQVTVTEVPKAKPAEAVKADLITMFNTGEEFTLLDFSGEVIQTAYTNCIMTNLHFEEDPDSGDAVYPVMTIERVSYATSTSVKIKTRVAASVAGSAATQVNKGSQNPDRGTSDKDLDPGKVQGNTNKPRKSVILGG